MTTKRELNGMLDRWIAAPDAPATCDLLCVVAESLGLDDAEYSVDDLRERIAGSDLPG